MKTFLLSFAVLATMAACTKLNAQCTVTPPVISNIVKASCNVTFDLTFTISGNNGNKVTAVYIYNAVDYAALSSTFYGQNNNKVPSIADLNAAKALAVIKVHADSAKTLYAYQVQSNVAQRPKAMLSSLNFSVNTSAAQSTITIKDVSVNLTNCNSYVSLKADVLSSQSPDLSSVGCVAKGLTFSPNDPILGTANIGCTNVRSVQTTFFTTTSRDIVFRMYKDVEPFGIFTEADTATAVSSWYSTSTVYNSSSDNYSASGKFDYNVQTGEKFNVWVIAYASGVSNVSASLATNSCAALPTTFRSISAQRNQQSVLVKWETVTEQQNRGFNVQRQIGNGTWQNIGFVATQAVGGNSSGLLSYTYMDPNPSKRVSQYRLQQIDIDGKLTYSEIRSVRSDELSGGVAVYPNPSADGKITLSFEAASSAKDVIVSDMTGRVVKQFKSVKNSNLTIDNLNTGFYTIQVFDQSTLKTVVEKVVVKK